MSEIKAFKGYRPRKDIVDKLISPPYDVLSSEEAKDMVSGNEVSFLHVVKPEIDLPDGTDLYAEEVYKKGAENLRRFIKEGILVKDTSPSLYLYTQKMGDHIQTGLIALASAQEYIDNKIRKHEHTKPDKVIDRTKHITTQGAHSGPVFLTYKNRKMIDSIIEKIQNNTSPDVDTVTPDGVGHKLWVVNNSEDINSIVNEFNKIDVMYIADGHHRSASAVENYKLDGTDKTAFFLAVIFPHNQLKIMDYNRAVKDLNNMSESDFLNAVSDNFIIHESSTAKPDRKHKVGMYLSGKWYQLEMKPEIIDETDPVKRLDVYILQNYLLDPVLGIKDPRTDKRIDFIGGLRGISELEKLVNSGKFKISFAMYPVSIDELISIADADKVMPPKSTWFEPKLKSGLVVNVFKD